MNHYAKRCAYWNLKNTKRHDWNRKTHPLRNITMFLHNTQLLCPTSELNDQVLRSKTIIMLRINNGPCFSLKMNYIYSLKLGKKLALNNTITHTSTDTLLVICLQRLMNHDGGIECAYSYKDAKFT